jgi:hypothetical protein
MLTASSIWINVASVFAGCSLIVGLGLLFVRAVNIERRWLVGLCTILGSGLGIFLISNYKAFGPANEVTVAAASALFCVLGFLIGRAIDISLGSREPDTMQADAATYNVDLAD